VQGSETVKILFVHEVSWRKKVVYEIHDFPELLALRGHDVTFVEYDEDEGNLEHEGWDTQKKVLSSISLNSRAHPGSEVRVITPRRFLPGILGRLLAILLHPYVIYRELKKNRPDVVVLYAVPTNGWQTTLIAKRMKIPVVFRAIDVSHQLRKSIFSRLIVKAEKTVYKNASHISTHNYALKEYITTYGCDEDQITVLLPGVDLERFTPQPPSLQLQKSLGLSDGDQVILFMGTIFRFSGVAELIEEASELLKENPSTKFLVLGDGEDLERVRQIAKTLGLSKQVVTPGRVSYDDLAENLCVGTVAILPFLQESVTDFALPWKVAQYLGCGLPTVSINLKGLASVIPEGSGMIYVDDIPSLVQATFELLRDENQRAQLAQDARQTMVDLCNWDNQVQKLETLLLQTMKESE
jgi:glycosyltransferase involved in cell wall biosynthesis